MPAKVHLRLVVASGAVFVDPIICVCMFVWRKWGWGLRPFEECLKRYVVELFEFWSAVMDANGH